MEPEPHKAPLRFYEIDLLRFLSAVSVVLYHYTFRAYAQGNYSPVEFAGLGQLTRYGWLGVELFFIISGYVVLMSAYNKSIKKFFLSRVTRLYPAYWVACTVTFLVVKFFGPHAPAFGWESFVVTVRQYVYNLTMLNSFLGVENIDTAYWSLAYELVFYFLIAMALGWGLFKHLDVLLACWLLYTAVAGPWNTTVLAHLLIPKYSPYFISGMLFFMLQNKLGNRKLQLGLLGFAFLLALRCVRAETQGLSGYFHTPISTTITASAVGCFYLIFWLLITRRINLSRFAWLSTLGAITYPLYLFHGNIGFVVFHLTPGLNKYLVLVGLLVVMLVISYMVHRFVEKKGSRVLGTFVNRALDWLGTIGAPSSSLAKDSRN
jgi:peptidoglycan/LPS O-acetylase OafA/YrhL